MREKYIDEKVGIWIIFGKSPDGLTVDVSDQRRDIFENLPISQAEAICKLQQEFRDKIYKLLNGIRDKNDSIVHETPVSVSSADCEY